MTATVHSFISLYREHRLPCPCKPGRVCATHQCIDLADGLRELLADSDELLVPAEEHIAVIEHVLDVLDGITGARTRARETHKNHTQERQETHQ